VSYYLIDHRNWEIMLDKTRLILTAITIAINLVPIAGILLAYQNNLPGLVVPPEIDRITNGGFITEEPLEPPVFVDSQYNVTSHTVTLTFQFTNPFNFDVTINSMSADIQCDAHNFPLGHATLNNPVNIRASETATITVLGTWTQDAINHFQTAHAGAQSIDVELVGLTINVNGINVQTNEHIKISNVPIA
jgi:hypothetical protein